MTTLPTPVTAPLMSTDASSSGSADALPPIADLVPHSGAMCLLDSVLEIGEEHLIARITPDRQDPFANDHGIPGWVGLEWLAQAIAAWSGRAAREAGGEPRIGFLLGSRHYHCDVEHFVFDSPVEVKVELDYRADNGLGAFRGELRDTEDRRLAHATLNVFQPDSAETLSAMLEDSAP